MQQLNFKAEGFRPKRENWVVSVRTIQLADNFLCFFDGQNKAGEPEFTPDDDNWGQLDMNLGLACYVLFKGKEAVVVDTMLTVEQARYVRWRMESLGVEKFTVINTHMDMDHTGGNEMFADCTILALQGTYDALLKHKPLIENAGLWGPPATNPLILPNKLIEGNTTITLAGFKLHLLRVDAHQEGGSICVHIPAYRALLAGDVAEDAAVFINQPQNAPGYIKETRRLLKLDIDYVFPSHGNPDIIAKGGYGKRFLEACIVYQERLLERVNEPGFQEGRLEDFMADYLKDGSLHYREIYEDIHRSNCENIYKHWAHHAARSRQHPQ